MKTKKLKNYLQKVTFTRKGAAYLCDIDYLTLGSKKLIKLINLNSGRISFTSIVTNINSGIQ